MNRRRWLLGAAGAAALAAGAGWQAWRAGDDDEASALWGLRFPQPDGGELVMAERRGHPLLLNFWATWCPPCIREMPTLDRFQKRFADRGWQVVGLAIDGPTPVREYLKRLPVGFAIGLAGFDGTDIARQLGNTSGSLPYTVVLDGQGRIVHRKLGESKESDLNRWAETLK